MARPVTLFTGQWADLPLEELAAKVASWGFDGLELACWGDHFEVDRALAEPDYLEAEFFRARLLRRMKDEAGAEAVLRKLAVCEQADPLVRAQASADIAQLGQADKRRVAPPGHPLAHRDHGAAIGAALHSDIVDKSPHEPTTPLEAMR